MDECMVSLINEKREREREVAARPNFTAYGLTLFLG